MPSIQLWHTRDRAFAVPADLTLSPGEVEVRCGLRRAFVDPEALEPYAVEPEEARAMSRSQVDEALGDLGRKWREVADAARLPAVGRLFEAAVGVLPAEGTAAREGLPEALADGLRRFVEAARDPARQAATQERVRAARERHLEDNPALAAARSALQQALAEATPVVADGLANVAARVREATERARRP